MIYLDEQHIESLGADWTQTIPAIENAVRCLSRNDYSQPIKPYLRYRNPKNRIIAMPAFAGGDVNMAGIKWIASFPENIDKGLARAHSVVVLNRAETGEPICIINTASLSIIRTASVSGLVLKYFNAVRPMMDIKVAIMGWGPIGRCHYRMCCDVFGDRIKQAHLFDIRNIKPGSVPKLGTHEVRIANDWREAYADADVFITCTVANAAYIDEQPKPGSLHLNVSLRDYQLDVFDSFRDAIIVDDWAEVCRQQTDIERMHLEKGLQEKDTHSIVDVVESNCLAKLQVDQPVMFNPMGMAVFDIAIGTHYYNSAKCSGVGVEL